MGINALPDMMHTNKMELTVSNSRGIGEDVTVGESPLVYEA